VAGQAIDRTFYGWARRDRHRARRATCGARGCPGGARPWPRCSSRKRSPGAGRRRFRGSRPSRPVADRVQARAGPGCASRGFPTEPGRHCGGRQRGDAVGGRGANMEPRAERGGGAVTNSGSQGEPTPSTSTRQQVVPGDARGTRSSSSGNRLSPGPMRRRRPRQPTRRLAVVAWTYGRHVVGRGRR